MRVIKLCLLVVALFSASAHSMSKKPPEPICAEPTPIGAAFSRTQCEYNHLVYSGRPKRKFPVSFIVPTWGDNLTLEVDLHGYTAFPVTCTNDNGAKAGVIVQKQCAGHWPSLNQFPKGNAYPLGWFGVWDGRFATTSRIAKADDMAKEKWPNRIDAGKGATISGTSYGGTGSILQSIVLGERVSIVNARFPHLLFVKQDSDPDDNIDDRGEYWRNPAVRMAWGKTPPGVLDIRGAMERGLVDHIYYRVQGSTNDHLGRFDLEFFEHCEANKIACYGTWDKGGHDYEPGIGHNRNLYACGETDWRLDSTKLIVTGSTGNRLKDPNGNYYGRGHYNEGFCWKRTGNGVEVSYTPREIEGMLAMPDAVTFTGTIRDYPVEGDTFRYTFGAQSGTVQRSESGDITIEGLLLDSVKGFQKIELEPVAEWELVYVESNRTITDKRDYSLWDHGIGVGRIDGGFPESDIAIEDKYGNQKIIHNCTGSDKICATDDPRVSPDGKKILYWEGTGDYLKDVYTIGITPKEKTGAKDINALTECRLWVYELDTGQSYPVSDGHCDRTPEWLDNDTLVFASNRAKEYVPLTCPGKVSPVQGMQYKLGYQLYRADIVDRQLTSIERLTPHHSNLLSPEVTSSGRVFPSVHNAGERTCFNTSPKNAWYVANMDTNGADQTSAEFAFHRYPNMKTYSLVPTIDPRRRGILASTKAFRVVTEIEKGLFCGNEYYRNNHGGSNGILHCWRENNNEGVLKGNQLKSAEQFGAFSLDGSGQFVPSSHYVATPWAESQDALVRFDKQGRALGKVGGSFAHTGGAFGFTWVRGMSYTHAIDVSGVDFTDPKKLGGEPPAHRLIALAKVPVVTNPFDSEQVEILSSHPKKHRYAAAQIRPYRDHFGQDAPVQVPRLAKGKAILKSENVHEHQVFPIPGKTSKGERAAIQGNLEEGTITEACIDYIKPFKSQPQAFGLDIEETVCVPVAEDGSTEMEVDAERVFQMFWLDAGGKELARDHSLHSLRSGETRCCVGCHMHSEDAKPACD